MQEINLIFGARNGEFRITAIMLNNFYSYLVIRRKNIAGNNMPTKKKINGATYISIHNVLFPSSSVNKRFLPTDITTKKNEMRGGPTCLNN